MFDPNTRILVIDDMMTMRKLIGRALKELGFSVITEAADGEIGWKILDADPTFGLIISDWNMPNVSGLDLLKRLRADARFKNIPFVMVTAEAEQGQIVQAISAGVTNYLVKPFTANLLKEKLEVAYKKVA